ncbi:MAG TPA: glycosyltransferase family 2 protein [Candidatus Binatia bacterium]|nr:glycosyltransferase family 2 protein [Candidatus Binatia bacterium]
MAATTFWGMLAIVVYVYAGFPLLVWLVSRLHPRQVRKHPVPPPTVSFIIAAYNEERSIAKKLANTFALEYPADRLEILVVSDGSSDRTEEIVRAEGGGRVKLLALGSRNGKTIAQNRAVESATGEIVVFSDATTVYEPRCLRALVSNFADPEVGAATGWVVMGADPDATMQKGRSAYTDYDQWLRSCEAKVHSVVGTAGCIAALRRELFRPLPADVDADVAEALEVSAQGYRVVFEDDAVVYEAGESGSVREELERRTRVIARGLRGYWYARRVFHPLRHPWFFLDLLSHRLLRWAVPVLLAIAFLANLALLGDPVYVVTLLAQVAFYGTAAVGYVLERRQVRAPGLFIPLYFCVVNLAPLLAVRQLYRGRTTAVWETGRS